jgi:GNAT superfamily N-acetyltransferase
MRRKVVSVTPKTLQQSGLKCAACLKWEGLSLSDDEQIRSKKTELARQAIKTWGEFGKIAYVGNQALAYAQFAPPEFWPGAGRFSANQVSDDAILLTCLNVEPLARGRGLGRVLLQSVEASLVKRRVKAIVTFTTRGEGNPPGPIEFYLQNGFYILKDDPKIPLLRLELKTLVGWQINIQFALDKIKIPTRAIVAPPA